MNEQKAAYGINISGYINKQFGLGEGVRSNIRAIKSTDIPYVLNDFNIVLSKHVVDDAKNQLEISAENPYNINLVQINIDRLQQVIEQTDKSYFLDKYNIGFWAWELENFPEKSKIYFDLFDEIWVPSNFCTEAISKVSPVPVLKMMHSIEIEKPTFSRKEFGLPEDHFVFLTMFDYYSFLNRKNPIATIDAYEKAFGKNNEQVLLVIKTSISKEFPEDRKKLTDRISDNTSIIIIEEILDRDRLYSLMNCCDAFISLHRSEGFGLTMAEAMYLGKPTIATGYSANIEFMTVNNSFLVQYTMISAGNQYYFSTEKDYWADADVEDASRKMLFVVNHPEETAHIARRGQQDVQRYLSPKVIGEKMKERIKIINEDILPNRANGNAREDIFLELEIQRLKEKLNKLRSYKAVRLKIAFKNLQNKISGKDRKYFWEE